MLSFDEILDRISHPERWSPTEVRRARDELAGLSANERHDWLEFRREQQRARSYA